MSIDKQIIIKLKAEFQQAAGFLDPSAVQILREFMHDFIAKNKISEVSTSARSTIKERQAAVSFGRASVALEGFAVSSAAEAQQQRWVRGEISMEECIACIKQAHQDE